MTREILFRGKRLYSDEWLFGDLSHQLGKIYVFPEDGWNSFDYYEIDPSTIGQYTGLTDKNGKKIFEGDILVWSELLEGCVGTCVVRYGKFNCGCCDGVYGWYLDGGDIRHFNSKYPTDYEVCGNIYDNPELLEYK